MPEIPAQLTPWLRRLQYLYERFNSDRCRDTAAALTYMSLFAMVPLLTVLYTMASAVPAFQGVEANIQDLLFEHLMPETSSDMEQYLEDFSRQAKNLTGFGIAFLVATAILMLRNIERSFNRIWRTPENRSPVSSFLLYWAVLSLTPVTIGLGLAASTYLASFASRLGHLDVIGAGAAFLRIAPFLLSVLGFTLVYAAVPNCRVPVKHALIGGTLAAVAFNIARSLFTTLVAGSSITFIYGAFAAVPLFLLWIFISWNIVLIAAIVVHSLSAYQTSEQAARPLALKALEALYLLWQRQRRGETLREIDVLTDRTCGIDSESWGRLRDIFLAERIISQNERGHYLLARDLHDITLWQVLHWTRGDALATDYADCHAAEGWEQRALTLLAAQEDANRAALSINLAELFEQ
jgi:membrane protein